MLPPPKKGVQKEYLELHLVLLLNTLRVILPYKVTTINEAINLTTYSKHAYIALYTTCIAVPALYRWQG